MKVIKKIEIKEEAMEGTKFAVCFICCILLGTSLSGPVPSSQEKLQEFEHSIESLKVELKLLKEESFHQRRLRQTASTILNKNRKL